MDPIRNRAFKIAEQFLGPGLLGLILLGCLIVLRPFVSAILWAAILCYATWPACEWLVRHLKGRRPPMEGQDLPGDRIQVPDPGPKDLVGLGPHVQADPTALYTAAQFETALTTGVSSGFTSLPGLSKFNEDRVANIKQQFAGTAKSSNNGNGSCSGSFW